MVKLVGCRPGLWDVLLQASWRWNKFNIPSKNALILCQKNLTLYSILRTWNAPTFCSNTPPKWGIWDVTVGVFLLLVPIHGMGNPEKNHLDGIKHFLYDDIMGVTQPPKLCSNILPLEVLYINLEELIGYEAPPGLMSLSICLSVYPSVHPSICLEYQII